MKLWKQMSFLFVIFAFSLVLVAAAAQVDKGNSQPVAAQNGKGDTAKGKQVFEENCLICHNADSAEDKVGPGLKGISKKAAHKMSDGTEHKDHGEAVLRKQVKDGGGSMPPVGASFTDKEMNDITAYLMSL